MSVIVSRSILKLQQVIYTLHFERLLKVHNPVNDSWVQFEDLEAFESCSFTLYFQSPAVLMLIIWETIVRHIHLKELYIIGLFGQQKHSPCVLATASEVLLALILQFNAVRLVVDLQICIYGLRALFGYFRVCSFQFSSYFHLIDSAQIC